MTGRFLLLALIASLGMPQAALANTAGILCTLYVGVTDKILIQTGDNTLSATVRGVTATIYSMQDNSFKTFQAVLNVPKLSDIRAYGTKDSLTALSGDVVGYLNHSRMDEIAVNCKLNSTNAADLTVSEETFGCEDWNVYVKLFKFLVVDKDNEAFGRILLNSNNKCYVFRKGAVVEIESTAKLDDVEAECVRPRGDPNCYWMASRFSHISR